MYQDSMQEPTQNLTISKCRGKAKQCTKMGISCNTAFHSTDHLAGDNYYLKHGLSTPSLLLTLFNAVHPSLPQSVVHPQG